MKAREQRRKVLVQARIRHGAAWSDIRILDVSSRGMCLQGSASPPPGTYVELSRGQQSVVARVVWSSPERFGVFAQDFVPVEALLNGTATPAPAGATTCFDQHAPTRRAERHDRSRVAARAWEFGIIAIAGGFAALMVQEAVRTAVAAPMAAVGAALEGPRR